MPKPTKSTLLAVLATTALVGVSGPAAMGGGTAPDARPTFKPSPKLVAQVRAATEKYADVDRALADGYLATKNCYAPKGEGAMGFHYAHKRHVLDRKVDITKPEVLLYAPKKGGGVRLVGVEYFVVDADQNVETRDADLPKPLGHRMDGPMLGHEPGMPIHNDLHLWLYEKNPDGLFASFNPKRLCG